jgi:hypothetical protein
MSVSNRVWDERGRDDEPLGERILGNIGSGIAWGTAIAALLSMYALAVYFGVGVDEADPPPYGIHHVILLYFMGGIIGGTIFGLAKPLTVRWWGAPIVGFVVAIPFFSAFFLLEGSFRIEFVLLGSLLLGPMVGLGYWFIFRS